MLTNYSAFYGQSIYDVCLNTYGSLEFLSKLLIDSNINNINAVPKTNQQFLYDTDLTVDDNMKKIYPPVIFATGIFLDVSQAIITETGFFILTETGSKMVTETTLT